MDINDPLNPLNPWSPFSPWGPLNPNNMQPDHIAGPTPPPPMWLLWVAIGAFVSILAWALYMTREDS